jgi:hypothetical protein
LAEHKKPPPPTPDTTDPDLQPVRADPKRFDLEAEVTVNADLTQAGREPPKASETMLGGESADDLKGPRGTFDDLSEESAIPSLSGLAAHPGSTAIFDDEETQAIPGPVSETETPTPVKPKGNTGKQAAYKPVKKLDAASGLNRAHKSKPRPQPMDADAFEPVARAGELSNTTHNDMNPSFGLLSRLANESLPVKIGLAAAIVSLTAFVFWLIFLAAR